MKTQTYLIAICALLAGTLQAAIPQISWDIETTAVVPVPRDLLRGETVDLLPRYTSNRQPISITNVTEVLMRYRSADMQPGEYYVATGTVHNAEAGIVRIPWGPDQAAAASIYQYTIVARSPDGEMLRGLGSIRLLGTVSGEPTNVPTITAEYDWSRVINTPTTLAGYGITDALTTEQDPIFDAWLAADPLAGMVTGTPWQAEGYLTAEADPVFAGWLNTDYATDQSNLVAAIAAAEPGNYAAVSNAALQAQSWGDHAVAGYASTNALAELAGNVALRVGSNTFTSPEDKSEVSTNTFNTAVVFTDPLFLGGASDSDFVYHDGVFRRIGVPVGGGSSNRLALATGEVYDSAGRLAVDSTGRLLASLATGMQPPEDYIVWRVSGTASSGQEIVNFETMQAAIAAAEPGNYAAVSNAALQAVQPDALSGYLTTSAWAVADSTTNYMQRTLQTATNAALLANINTRLLASDPAYLAALTNLTAGASISITGTGRARTIAATGLISVSDPSYLAALTNVTAGAGISVTGTGRTRTIAASGLVPDTRSVTINGQTQTLSSNLNFSVAGHTPIDWATDYPADHAGYIAISNTAAGALQRSGGTMSGNLTATSITLGGETLTEWPSVDTIVITNAIQTSSTFPVWEPAGGTFATNNAIVAISDLISNGVAQVYAEKSGIMLPLWQMSADGVTWTNWVPTNADIYLRLSLEESAPSPFDRTTSISNIQARSWTHPHLFGVESDTAGQLIHVDTPATARQIANKGYVDNQVGAITPAGWSQYPATETVWLNGNKLIMGSGWSIIEVDGVGVVSYADLYGGTNGLVIANNGTPMITALAGLQGLQIASLSISAGVATVDIVTNGVHSPPMLQWTPSLSAIDWQILTPTSSSYPDLVGAYYRIIAPLPEGNMGFIRAVRETGAARVDMHSRLYVQEREVVTTSPSRTPQQITYTGTEVLVEWTHAYQVLQPTGTVYISIAPGDAATIDTMRLDVLPSAHMVVWNGTNQAHFAGWVGAEPATNRGSYIIDSAFGTTNVTAGVLHEM
jgi:hypothetical protein